jgi:hypothetical protein
VLSVRIKSDGYANAGIDTQIRIRDTVNPIRIRIPFRDTSRQVFNETIHDPSNARRILESVKLVNFHDISDENENIRMYHLRLLHGSSFYMVINTKSEPSWQYEGIEYQVALVKDYRPTTEEFCRNDSSHTRRFSSGEVVEFKIEENEGHDRNEYLKFNYLNFEFRKVKFF